MKQLLTHSRQDCFKTCRRKHYFAYEMGLRRIEDAKALRMGSAFHAAIEQLGRDNIDAAWAGLYDRYARCPEPFDVYWWDIERETLARLVAGYQWRWSETPLEFLQTEHMFQIPLINPATGAETPIFDLAGKIDGIVRLEDGRLAVMETKTTSDDLGMDAPLWKRLRIDHQISLYIHAARAEGFDVQTVLYNVVRKPSIQATPVPLVDLDGIKIVYDAAGDRVKTKDGKKFRQTADTELGYRLATRDMTPDEWGQKLALDIAERPDFYFARREIPRLNADVDEYQAELWEIQQSIREAQRTQRWYRTVNRNTCTYCEYFDPCTGAVDLAQGCPPGFTVVSDIHPELERDRNASSSSCTAEDAATIAAAADGKLIALPIADGSQTAVDDH